MTAGPRSAAAVDAVSARAYAVPTDFPEGDGTLAWDATTIVVTEARSGDVAGVGYTYAPVACASVVNDELEPVLAGGDAFDIPAAAMAAAVRNMGREGVAGYAISAVDIALWDLKARLLGIPLTLLLGAARPEVPVYGSGGFTTYDDRRQAEQLEGWAASGFSRFKIKIGEDRGTRVARDLRRVDRARKVIGPEAELYVDANGAYSPKQAIRVAERLTEQRVIWFEEPVSSADLGGLRAVRERIGPDVAAGEYGCTVEYFESMCAAGAVDCLQADVTRCGGISGWLRAAAVAEAHGLEISGHCAPSAHAAVAASVPNLRHLEWFHDHARIETEFFEGVLRLRERAPRGDRRGVPA